MAWPATFGRIRLRVGCFKGCGRRDHLARSQIFISTKIHLMSVNTVNNQY